MSHPMARRSERTRRLAGLFLAARLLIPAGADTAPPPEELARMWAVPGLPEVEHIAWADLPAYRSRSSVIIRGVPGDSGHMHHPSIVYFDGRYLAAWNDGYRLEDRPGQRVRFATSADGLAWSAPQELSGRHPRRRYTTGGLWIRDGELYALAALRDARDIEPTGEDPLLFAYRWDRRTGRFGEGQVILREYFAQNVPQRAPDGDWLVLGKDGRSSWQTMKSAKGGVRALADWTVRDLPAAGPMEEAEWYALPNGHLVAHFRTRPLRRLLRSYSVDSGVTWTNPVVTDFPEAGARHHGLRLSNGLYALLVNPNTSGQRLPFSIALSRDGLRYDRIANVRADSPSGGHGNERPGYHYMRGFEHGGQLITIYSINQADIGVTLIPITEFEALYR
ncbi:MAG: exo-alpha-sialidase [Opitutaceae bacterium]|nr:exo-alpha-sialidase [Opitutaceae bacterium]